MVRPRFLGAEEFLRGTPPGRQSSGCCETGKFAPDLIHCGVLARFDSRTGRLGGIGAPCCFAHRLPFVILVPVPERSAGPMFWLDR
jgi:hypothetical protein